MIIVSLLLLLLLLLLHLLLLLLLLLFLLLLLLPLRGLTGRLLSTLLAVTIATVMIAGGSIFPSPVP